jgi:hypothetical protein
MLWVPTESVAVVQYAFFVVPLPVRMLAEQPGIDVPSLVKFTVPPGGELAFTLAENVMLAPEVDGLSELPTKIKVDCAYACADNCKQSATRTLAMPRGRRSWMRPSPVIETELPAFDSALIVQPGFVLAEGSRPRGRLVVHGTLHPTGARHANDVVHVIERNRCGPHHDHITTAVEATSHAATFMPTVCWPTLRQARCVTIGVGA